MKLEMDFQLKALVGQRDLYMNVLLVALWRKVCTLVRVAVQIGSSEVH